MKSKYKQKIFLVDEYSLIYYKRFLKISPIFLEKSIMIYNGKSFFNLLVKTQNMFYKPIGLFSMTRKIGVVHKKK